MTNGYNYMWVNFLFECNTTQNTTISKDKLCFTLSQLRLALKKV